jgi:hypothetical protein
LLQAVVVAQTMDQMVVQVVAQLVLPAQLIRLTFQVVLLVVQELLSLPLLLRVRRARQVHVVHSDEVAWEEILMDQVVVVVGMEALVAGMTQVVVVVLDIYPHHLLVQQLLQGLDQVQGKQ